MRKSAHVHLAPMAVGAIAAVLEHVPAHMFEDLRRRCRWCALVQGPIQSKVRRSRSSADHTDKRTFTRFEFPARRSR